jgi:hypothetical protein
MRFRFLAAGLFALGLLPLAQAEQKAVPSYPDSEAGGHAGEEATVVGKVVTVSKSGKGNIYMNFGDRFPRQTFSGVVFAGDQEKVGDLGAYEGKIVAITGRIELSPDKRPQIVIRSAEQLKLSEPGGEPPAPVVPTPAPMPAPAPEPSPQPANPASRSSQPAPSPAPQPTPPPQAPGARKITLSPSWNTAPQTGDMTRKDLALLFGGMGSAGSGNVSDASIFVYPEIPYLMPLGDARKRLKLEGSSPTRTKVTTPGMPSASLSANTFSGIFPGGFTSLTLITDAADQIVSVLAVDDNPRQRTPNAADTTGYHTYNFINLRVKAANELIIRHEIAKSGSPAGVVVVDSVLIDPNAAEATPQFRSATRSSRTTTSRPRTGKVLERSRWYVPVPFVDLILRSVGNR